MTRQERRKRFEAIDLYPVITEKFCAGRSSLEICKAVIAGGARIVQLREKDKSWREVCRLAGQFRELTARAGVLLVINDYLDIALEVEADGVHLGSEDMPLAAARNVAPELIIGISSHNLAEARQAELQGADYINIGPLYPTSTKAGFSDYLGPERMSGIIQAIRVPCTVMGGINPDNLDEIIRYGARRVAMITGITQAGDVAGRVRELRRRIASGL
ncbi:thiamine phosphate synthase [bacterium]|nr:thiamine phosphate synthase [bacterium]